MTLREAVKLLDTGRGFRDARKQLALEIILTHCYADIGRESVDRGEPEDKDGDEEL